MTKFVKATDKELASLAELIENATSKDLGEVKAFVPICDIINSSSEGPKEAVKIIKKRLATKNPIIVNLTMSLLDTCVRNCGLRFHSQVFNRDFLQGLLKVIKPKNNPSMETQTAVLAFIQRWAIANQGVSELREICRTYEELMNKSVEFPTRDPDQVSEIYILSTTNPNSLFGGDRRESTRSVGMLQGDCLTVYEVDPSSATLCPTGSSRRRGSSVEPKFPHRNTLNPSGRSPSRDRSPGPGGVRRPSFVPNAGDNDLRITAMRKQSFFVVAPDPVYGGGDRKLSCFANTDGQLPVLFQGQDRKLSLAVPAMQGQLRKQSYAGSAETLQVAKAQERKHSYTYTGSATGRTSPAVCDLQSELASIRQNCQFFGEMLSTVKPGKELASDKELLQECNMTCLEMKKRVVRLLETPEGEKISDELLSLNDELNTVLFRYQKYSRSAAALKDRPAPSNGGITQTVHQPITITVEDGDNHSSLIDLESSNGSVKSGRL